MISLNPPETKKTDLTGESYDILLEYRHHFAEDDIESMYDRLCEELIFDSFQYEYLKCKIKEELKEESEELMERLREINNTLKKLY